jgi:ribosomal protein L11 methyltransferase
MLPQDRWGIVTWTLPQELEDTACAILGRAGTAGAAIAYLDDRTVSVQAYFPPGTPMERLAEDLAEQMARATTRPVIPPAIAFEDPADWVALGRDSHRAMAVGRHFVIHPSWDIPADGGRPLAIQIDPQQAFGTGSHETTRLCVELMEKHLRARHRRCLDVGCGSGVLMIAVDRWVRWRWPRTAPRFRVDGIDLDGASIEVARENCRINGVALTHTLRCVMLEELAAAPYHFIFANLLSGIIRANLTRLDRLLKPGGRMILSGLLTAEIPELRGPVAERDLQILAEAAAGDWAALVLAKPPGRTAPQR